MNAKSKSIWMLAVAFFATVLLASASPAVARDRSSRRRGGESRRQRRGDRDSRRERDRSSRYSRPNRGGHGGLLSRRGIRIGGGGISVRIGSSGVSVRRRYVAGYYRTRTESVLVRAGRYEWQYREVLVEAGHYETRYGGPVTETVYDSQGNPHTVVIQSGRPTVRRGIRRR